MELDWDENKISVKLQTEFPWVNTYSLEVKDVPAGGMDLLPGFCLIITGKIKTIMCRIRILQNILSIWTVLWDNEKKNAHKKHLLS